MATVFKLDLPYGEIIERYAKVRVLVIGDAMVDVYHFGRAERISPEAPVPIFIEERMEIRRGGADNVAHQLEVLGCTVQMCCAPTGTRKHRYFAGHHQVFRIDQDVHAAPTAKQVEGIRHSQAEVIVLSDYAKGFLTPEMCRAAIDTGIPTVVDPKGISWSQYEGARILSPNQFEFDRYSGHYARWQLVVKCGEKGLKVFDGVDEFEEIPTTAKQVYDVTGAGDTVTALLAASIAVGASLEEAAVLANHAAGVVVGKLGTAVCTKEELLESLCA